MLALALIAAVFVNVNIGWDTHLDLLTAWLPRAETSTTGIT